MNHHDQKTLDQVFAHPVSANVDFQDMEHLLKKLGAELEEKSAGKIMIKMNGKSMIIHRPHQHTMAKDEVIAVRGFLEECGVSA
jgi:NACalpha-BTF3-like transcription factor